MALEVGVPTFCFYGKMDVNLTFRNYLQRFSVRIIEKLNPVQKKKSKRNL
ncbi:hypothetical protein LEP1GSC161_3434 [Leptospira santarosai str. CBC1416]|uniref:Uncharacterized protein n=2 Tax=Leptospira santarosai TaxID=28183 RepID=M6VGL3_9LEPT|nr:hypothetical protein LEP1GSC169_1793 [Leptospira santarosai str. HAI1349]EMM85206.1 hypothetical protein LEP1GSC039_0285 [Leptospira santarosai str. 2000027870]EMO24162.1 hypothetical protein LEP1GSC168_3211 [Leptospira santarosai str. HAI134]EMO33036.1 hypothetical protein LEP1GSC175_1562 [Leptospira santarosai str. HAI821]EMO55985.1 hypothetical protein LEP1GSC161_3434 [Leptospira santarosai str. CBC1416]EMP80374.1 hypothetical protein LEP1GSC162_3427 [Leptospira santarosai str. CBC1531]